MQQKNDELVAEKLRCSVLDLDGVDTMLYLRVLMAAQVEYDVRENPHKKGIEPDTVH